MDWENTFFQFYPAANVIHLRKFIFNLKNTPHTHCIQLLSLYLYLFIYLFIVDLFIVDLFIVNLFIYLFIVTLYNKRRKKFSEETDL